MRPRRISLASLLGIVAVFGLGLAGLKSSTVLWTTAATTVTLALLLAAVLGAVLLRGPERAFWLGFALFGWVYLVLVDWSWIGAQVGHDLTGGFRELVDALFPQDPNLRFTPTSPQQFEEARKRDIRIGNAVQISRLFLCLLFALVGGLIGRAFAARREDRQPGPAVS
jgi:hypothetical protein